MEQKLMVEIFVPNKGDRWYALPSKFFDVLSSTSLPILEDLKKNDLKMIYQGLDILKKNQKGIPDPIIKFSKKTNLELQELLEQRKKAEDALDKVLFIPHPTENRWI